MALGDMFTKTAKGPEPTTPPEKTYSDGELDAGLGVEDVNNPPRLVDPETEKRLIRKLDKRIIPMVMWMYLMSFMVRVHGQSSIVSL